MRTGNAVPRLRHRPGETISNPEIVQPDLHIFQFPLLVLKLLPSARDVRVLLQQLLNALRRVLPPEVKLPQEERLQPVREALHEVVVDRLRDVVYHTLYTPARTRDQHASGSWNADDNGRKTRLVCDLEVAPDVRHDDELVAEFVCGEEFSQVHRADVRIRWDRSDRSDRLVDWTVEGAIKLSSTGVREAGRRRNGRTCARCSHRRVGSLCVYCVSSEPVLGVAERAHFLVVPQPDLARRLEVVAVLREVRELFTLQHLLHRGLRGVEGALDALL